MRTIRVDLEAPVGDNASTLGAMFGGGMRLRISTEAIVGNDADARQAGQEAARVVAEFIAGYAEAETA